MVLKPADTCDIADLLTQIYSGEAAQGIIDIVTKPARTSGGWSSRMYHHTDVPEGVLAIQRRLVQHHHEQVRVCTLFYEHEDQANDALKASGLAWFDKRVGGWNVPTVMDHESAQYIAGILSSHFEDLFDIDEEKTRSRNPDAPGPQDTDIIQLIPFHVPVAFDHVQAAIRDLRPDDDLSVPMYVHVGGGYAEWPRERTGEDADPADVMTRYPFLLVCYDDPVAGRRYVSYSVLGRMAERIETGAGRTTRELFMRIACTERATKQRVLMEEGLEDPALERPGDRQHYRDDIPRQAFDQWTAMCSYPVPHVLSRDYTLPSGRNVAGRAERDPARPGLDVAPPTDQYLRSIADFFGGNLSENATESFYASWPDQRMGFETAGEEEEEKPDDGKIPLILDWTIPSGDQPWITERLALGMIERFLDSGTVEDHETFTGVVLHMLALDATVEEAGADEEFIHAIDAAKKNAGRAPHHIETLMGIAHDVTEALGPKREFVMECNYGD